MRFIKTSLLYLTPISFSAVSANATAVPPLHKTKEEALGAFKSFQGTSSEAHEKHHVPPQVKSFKARKENRRDLSKFLSKYLKDTVLKELVGGDKSNKDSLKGKAARFLFNNKKDKMLDNMRKTSNKKGGDKLNQSRRTGQLMDKLFPWTKEPSPEITPQMKKDIVTAQAISNSPEEDDDGHFHDDYSGHDDVFMHDDFYYYRPPTLFDILDQLSMFVTGVNQTDYTAFVESLTSMVEAATDITIPSPEEFCADFDVTTTEEECVGAVSTVTTLIQGAIQAPWLLRDIVGYVETVVEEVVSWETIEALAAGILSLYGADGTIDGGLGAIRGVLVDLFALITAIDPYMSYYYPDYAELGGLMFDALPLTVATEVLAWDYNFLEYFGDDLYQTVWGLVSGIEYALGEGQVGWPDHELQEDICEAFGLVAANITATVSCDYFVDIGQGDIQTEGVTFCVEPSQDMEDYYTPLFTMESTFDVSTLEEAGMGWIVDDLQYKSWKYDDYNFTALESMTCSMKGYVSQPLVCNEKPMNTFLFKDGEERTCKWLRGRKHTDLICDHFYTARYACPSTCCMCGQEDPMDTFFRKFVDDEPEIKTCNWLAMRTPENLEKMCKKTFAPGDLKVASGACPVTCGLCEARDLCKEAIENWFLTNYYVEFVDNNTYKSAYWYSYGFNEYSYMYYYDLYESKYLGYFQGMEENAVILDYGDYCAEEEPYRYSSKVVVETTAELGMVGTYFSQTSPCSYELKVVIFCGEGNSTNSTWSGRELLHTVVDYFYPHPEDEVLDWQK